MRYAVETWDPSYGAAVETASLDETPGEVDVDVEIPAAQWRPIAPSAPTARLTVGFVDGIRRIDARVWIQDGDVTRPGVCASVAAGLVVCPPGRGEEPAAIADCLIGRGVFTPAGSEVGPIATHHGTYQLHPTADDSAEKLYNGVHQLMTDLELEVSAAAACELLVFDGPLRGRNRPGSVGYVKTQHVQYLPPELQGVLGRLGGGERTPVFLAGRNGRSRWSWYLRLPGPRSHPLSSIVRCELPAVGTVADAVAQADLVSGVLPRFASEPHKDPRAPQNLYPIAGLEQALRRRLGDALVLERALRIAAA